MSVDCSNPRHVAGLANRAYRSRRRDAKSLYAASDGSGWVPRTGSGDDWHSGRVAMGTCGRLYIACWMEFVCGCSNAPSARAELVCGCPRLTGAALCRRGTSKALRRKAPIALASISTVMEWTNAKAVSEDQAKSISSFLLPNQGMGTGWLASPEATRNGLWACLSKVTWTRASSMVTVAETSRRLRKSFLA